MLKDKKELTKPAATFANKVDFFPQEKRIKCTRLRMQRAELGRPTYLSRSSKKFGSVSSVK